MILKSIKRIKLTKITQRELLKEVTMNRNFMIKWINNIEGKTRKVCYSIHSKELVISNILHCRSVKERENRLLHCTRNFIIICSTGIRKQYYPSLIVKLEK